MQVGVVYPQTELRGDPEAVRRFGRAAEEMGYDYLIAYDHVVGASHDRIPQLTGPYTEHDPFHDPFVLFAYLAGMTQRLQFATGVLILPQRQTVLVAKQAADLDLLSGGRLRLGVGTGWNYVEYDALGQDFASRGARMDEQVQYLRRLWTEPLFSFDGRFDQMEQGSILPRPTRTIPIWMGGFSDPAFRRAARMGDGFMFAGSIEQGMVGIERVRQFAAQYNRDLSDFGMELTAVRAKTPDQFASEVQAWEEVGGTHLTLSTLRKHFDSVEAHIDFMGAVQERLKSAK